MPQDEMNTRMSRAEWEIAEALKDGHRQQSDKMAELAQRMDSHHKEVMAAIGSLRDDRARQEGAEEARLADADARQNRLKWLSFGLAVIGTLAALGWFGDEKNYRNIKRGKSTSHNEPVVISFLIILSFLQSAFPCPSITLPFQTFSCYGNASNPHQFVNVF